MKLKVFLFIILSFMLIACSDSSTGSNSSSSGTGGSNISNAKEFFTASSSKKAVSGRSGISPYGNDFEDEEAEGSRLFFSDTSGNISEVIYHIDGKDYKALVDDMAYIGHGFMALEIEELFDVKGRPALTNKETDRIALVNINDGFIKIVSNDTFRKCEDIESMEIIGGNTAFFVCENSAYKLDINTGSVELLGRPKDDKFDDSKVIFFNNYEGLYDNGKGTIKNIATDKPVISDITSLPEFTFKGIGDELYYIKKLSDRQAVYRLVYDKNSNKLTEENIYNYNIPLTAKGPVRNEDDSTYRYLNKLMFIDENKYYEMSIDPKGMSIRDNNWQLKEDLNIIAGNGFNDVDDSIAFGEKGIAYVKLDGLYYIGYQSNATPVKIEGITAKGNMIDDVSIIDDTLYFEVEENDIDKYYKVDLKGFPANLNAQEYQGSKNIIKVIDRGIALLPY